MTKYFNWSKSKGVINNGDIRHLFGRWQQQQPYFTKRKKAWEMFNTRGSKKPKDHNYKIVLFWN